MTKITENYREHYKDMPEPWYEGYQAAVDGAEPDTSPYKEDTKEHYSFMDGYEQAESDIENEEIESEDNDDNDDEDDAA